MRLIAKAKPVRIRISCGGQEHFSLESLRRSFSCREVAKLLDAPLVKWLNQQNEQQTAEKVRELIDRKETCTPVELASAFFDEEGIGEVNSPLSLFNFWLRYDYRENAVRFVEECYPTIRHSADFPILFNEYLRLSPRNILFLRDEEVDDSIAGSLPYVLADWKQAGYVREITEFVRRHEELFMRHAELQPFVERVKEREREKAKVRLPQPVVEEVKRRLMLAGYDCNSVKNSMHRRFADCSTEESSLCFWAALQAKEGLRTEVPPGYDDRLQALAFFRSIADAVSILNESLHGDSRTPKYLERRDLYEGRTEFAHIYDLTVYNIVRRLAGGTITYPDNTGTFELNLCAAYCYQVTASQPSTAITAIRAVCDAYTLSEKEFKKRHGNIPYIE